jgi:hypothetical protein
MDGVSELAHALSGFVRRAVIAAAAAALVAGAVSASAANAAPAAPAASGPAWRVSAVLPGAAEPVTLTAISASGARDAWAAGIGDTAAGLLLERWNGSTWKQFAAPAGFGGGVADYVIRSTSPTNMWTFPIVGNTTYGLHWNGRSWAKFTFRNVVIGTAAVFGPKSVWVFGSKVPTSAPYVAYYNGRAWKQWSLPVSPNSVTALSFSDIWGMGQTSKGTDIAVHWNGRAWKTLTIPTLPKFHKIPWFAYYAAATSAHDLWILDGLALNLASGTSPPGATLLHWNGSKWSVAAKNSSWWLYGLTPDGHGGFWLTGEKNQPVGVALFNTYIVHRSGGRWTAQKPPTPHGYTSDTAGLITPIPGTHSFWALGQLTSAGNLFGSVAILRYG